MPSIGNKPPKKIKKIPHGTLRRMLTRANRETDDALGLIDELNGRLVNANRQLADEIQHIANLKTKLAEHVQCIAQQNDNLANVLHEFKCQMKRTLTSQRVHNIVIRAIDQLINKLTITTPIQQIEA